MNKFRRISIITCGGIVGAIVGGGLLSIESNNIFNTTSLWLSFVGGSCGLSFGIASEYPKQRSDLGRNIAVPFYCLGIFVISFLLLLLSSIIYGMFYEKKAFIFNAISFQILTASMYALPLVLGASIAYRLLIKKNTLTRNLGRVIGGALFVSLFSYFYVTPNYYGFLLGGFTELGIVFGNIISEKYKRE